MKLERSGSQDAREVETIQGVLSRLDTLHASGVKVRKMSGESGLV